MHGMSVYLFGCGGERYANATVDAAGLIPFRLNRSLGNVVPTGDMLHSLVVRSVGGSIPARAGYARIFRLVWVVGFGCAQAAWVSLFRSARLSALVACGVPNGGGWERRGDSVWGTTGRCRCLGLELIGATAPADAARASRGRFGPVSERAFPNRLPVLPGSCADASCQIGTQALRIREIAKADTAGISRGGSLLEIDDF